MSFLQKQSATFLSEAQGAASRAPIQRRGLSPAPPSSGTKRPSPTPSVKRSYDDISRSSTPAPPILPPMNFSDKNIMTQVTGAVAWLREKANTHGARFYPFRDILGYLNMHLLPADDEQRLTLEHILQRHSKVEYTPPEAVKAEPEDEKKPIPAMKQGLYRFRPTHNVRSGEDLLSLLQTQHFPSGIPLSSLRDGWPNAVPAINALESQGLLLLTRAKKDNAPKRVWANDPSLLHPIDTEFSEIWGKLKPPANKADLRTQLLEFGLTPTSVVRPRGPVTKEKERKKRARRGGKVTNTHMQGVLKNFEHLRK